MADDVLAGIKARLDRERAEATRAEREIRDANDRYARATDNAKALERLLELYERYAANGDFERVSY